MPLWLRWDNLSDISQYHVCLRQVEWGDARRWQRMGTKNIRERQLIPLPNADLNVNSTHISAHTLGRRLSDFSSYAFSFYKSSSKTFKALTTLWPMRRVLRSRSFDGLIASQACLSAISAIQSKCVSAMLAHCLKPHETTTHEFARCLSTVRAAIVLHVLYGSAW